MDNNYVENLAAGNYQFTLTDSKDRKDTIAIEIESLPALDLESMSMPVDCESGTLGTIQVQSNAGTAPFQYLWSSGQTDSLVQNVPAGDYQVTVTDANGCTEELPSNVQVSGNLSLAINVIPISCHDAQDGVAIVSPTNGAAPYNFNWASGITDSIITDLIADTYEITVTDAIGCADELSFTINAPQELTAGFESYDLQCFGDDDGMVVAFPDGGTAPYHYSWNNLALNDTISNLSAGIYEVTITDAHNCVFSSSVEIFAPPQLEVDTAFGNISCWNENDGWASAMVFGGLPSYNYLWSTGDTIPEITNLPGGDYTVTISDANDCENIIEYTLTEPTTISIDDTNLALASTPWDNDGYIEILALSGGTPPYEFLWSTGDNTSSIDSLYGGTYGLTITDANDCQIQAAFEIQVISATKESSLENQLIALYPNPVAKSNFIHFVFKQKSTAAWNCSIFDTAGKLLSTEKILSDQQGIFRLKAPEQTGVFEVLVENEDGERGVFKVVVF